jgi:glycosyltransferase involved in cell wall biosynthesis
MREGVSICIATYNGAKFIKKQIDSILREILPSDELIIVDDCSTDETVSIIRRYGQKNIKLFQNAVNCGHVKSFEMALGMARNNYILLSDQDDIWLPGRLGDLINKSTAEGVALVTSNFGQIDEDDFNIGNSRYRLLEADSKSHLLNIIGLFWGTRPYFGCAMIINRKLLDIALPFPKWVEGHDVWLALCANAMHSNFHLEQKTLNRRLHSNNLTSLARRPILKILVTRYRMLMCLSIILFRFFLGKLSGISEFNKHA